FSTPVAITANTTYVASYHTNSGYPAFSLNGFTSAVDNAPLHALASGSSGGNGVYAYSATSVFPNQTWNASNYWVDVIFVPSDTTPPTVSTTSPVAGATGVAVGAAISTTFNEAMLASSITTSTVLLKDAGNNAV